MVETTISTAASTEITVSHSENTVKSSLIVVSNRLPFVLKRNADNSLTRIARYDFNYFLCEFFNSIYIILIFEVLSKKIKLNYYYAL